MSELAESGRNMRSYYLISSSEYAELLLFVDLICIKLIGLEKTEPFNI